MKKYLIVIYALAIMPAIAASQDKEAKVIANILDEWIDANNTKNLNKLGKLYGSTVLFYGESKSASTCISDKENFFKKNNYFIEINDLDVDFYDNGTVKCNFQKHETWGKVDRVDNAYLLFEKKGHRYLIVGESDGRMDRKYNVSLRLGDKENKKSTAPVILTTAVLSLMGLFIITKKRKKKPETKNTIVITKSDSQTVIVNEIPAPAMTAAEKGRAFEDFIVQKFDKTFFKLLNWRSDKFVEGFYALNNSDPDLEYEYSGKYERIKFSVECKWVQSLRNNCYEFDERKLNNYRAYHNRTNIHVFILLGVGGEPSDPANVYIIPLGKIINGTRKLTREQLSAFRRIKDGNFFLHAQSMMLE